jgi:hypothetical protein
MIAGQMVDTADYADDPPPSWNPRLSSLFNSRGARIFEFGVKSPPALSREIHDIPDGSRLVDTPFLDIGTQPWVPGITMTDRAVAISSENRYCRILVSFFVFTAEIVLKRA